jgi:hypothetical protein
MDFLIRIRTLSGYLASVVVIVVLALGAHAQSRAKPEVNRNSAIAADFEKRVGDYMKLRQKAQTGLTAPKNTDSPEKISEYQQGFAAKIRALRSDVKQGDIFTPEISGLFRNLVHSAFTSPDGEKIRKSFQRAEPLHGLRLDVNQSYPDGIPLQSMPPSLLLNLPQLPKELEYRFVGRELILRDIAPNLIADVLPDIQRPEDR